MTISFEYATETHFQWLRTMDGHISDVALRRKISEKEIIILGSESESLGFLRFGFFWDSIPFMNMLYIEEGYRKQGLGKKLVGFWELQMKEQEHSFLMTSSQSDEDAQHFYRKLGYSDAGSFTPPDEPLELLFIKRLS